jgi:hypothetical protein
LSAIEKFFKGIHVTVNARTEDEADADYILDKVAKASGSAYNFKLTESKENDGDSGPVVRIPLLMMAIILYYLYYCSVRFVPREQSTSVSIRAGRSMPKPVTISGLRRKKKRKRDKLRNNAVKKWSGKSARRN